MLKLKRTILPHLGNKILYYGADIATAAKALIMIHGRGADAQSMINLARHLNTENVICIIPEAAHFTWYPLRFIEKRQANEPGISSAFTLLSSIIASLKEQGFSDNEIHLLGFSQGACLCADYCARNPARYGGVYILSGGLIGDVLNPDEYKGDLQQTPVFLGCSSNDFHIPEERVRQSSEIFTVLKASVTSRIYPDLGHTINMDEIEFINGVLFN